jgi:hypothetical protein
MFSFYLPIHEDSFFSIPKVYQESQCHGDVNKLVGSLLNSIASEIVQK